MEGNFYRNINRGGGLYQSPEPGKLSLQGSESPEIDVNQFFETYPGGIKYSLLEKIQWVEGVISFAEQNISIAEDIISLYTDKLDALLEAIGPIASGDIFSRKESALNKLMVLQPKEGWNKYGLGTGSGPRF